MAELADHISTIEENSPNDNIPRENSPNGTIATENSPIVPTPTEKSSNDARSTENRQKFSGIFGNEEDDEALRYVLPAKTTNEEDGIFIKKELIPENFPQLFEENSSDVYGNSSSSSKVK